MKGRYFVCLIAVVVMATLVTVPVFSQSEPGKEAAPVGTPAATAPGEESPEVSELSIYGEVQAVNASANSLTVQYYDYDNDAEKTIDVVLDKDTKLENAAAITDIKKGDWTDITYVTSGGKNMAKLVSVEKEEVAAGENAPAADEE